MARNIDTSMHAQKLAERLRIVAGTAAALDPSLLPADLIRLIKHPSELGKLGDDELARINASIHAVAASLAAKASTTPLAVDTPPGTEDFQEHLDKHLVPYEVREHAIKEGDLQWGSATWLELATLGVATVAALAAAIQAWLTAKQKPPGRDVMISIYLEGGRLASEMSRDELVLALSRANHIYMIPIDSGKVGPLRRDWTDDYAGRIDPTLDHPVEGSPMPAIE